MSVPDSDADRYEEFLQHFTQAHDRLFAYILTLLPHRADAEDVFQRCSVLLWRKFEEFDRDREFLPWACGVAYYEVRNFLRVSARDRLQFKNELIQQLADRRMSKPDLTDGRISALRGCFAKLKTHDQELLSAVYGNAVTLSDFAKSTGRALQTLYNRLTLVRRRLQDCVERSLAVEGETA